MEFSSSAREGDEIENDWKASRFLLISILITCSIIIFFFSARFFFPNIKEEARVALNEVTRRVTQWGGFRLKSIELEVVDIDTPSLVPQRKKIYEDLAAKAKNELGKVFYGEPFWLLDLSKVKEEILQQGWAKSVYVRRSFPDSLEVSVVPRNPVFVVRAPRTWLIVDEDAHSVLVMDRIPGAFLGLPVILGLEENFSGVSSIEEYDRSLGPDREVLKDLFALMSNLSEKIGLSIRSVRVEDDAWSEEMVFTLDTSFEDALKNQKSLSISFLSHHWNNRLEGLQFVLSDLKSRPTGDNVTILGQYEGRFFVDRHWSPSKAASKAAVTWRTAKTGVRRKR